MRVLPKVQVRSGARCLVHPPVEHPPRKRLALRELLLEYVAERPSD